LASGKTIVRFINAAGRLDTHAVSSESLIGEAIISTFGSGFDILGFGLHTGLGLLGGSGGHLSGRSGFRSHVDKMEYSERKRSRGKEI
jgi:hypothetical protein